MRLHLLTGAIALGTLAAFGPLSAARADETFFCADGRTVTLTSENRETLRNHPCVKDWFAKEASRRVNNAVLATAVRRSTLALVRFPVSRALALRKVWGRSVQLAAVRTATAAVQQSYSTGPVTTPRVRVARPTVRMQPTASRTRFRFRLRRR